MDEIIILLRKKDEEIKKLHEVYDVENIMKMVETLTLLVVMLMTAQVSVLMLTQ